MITVLGASGYVGSHLVRYLDRSGLAFRAPARDEPLAGHDLGHVIYCIGLTADFRERPLDAVEAHVCKLLELVRQSAFESLLYLSTVRVYVGGTGMAHEDDELRMQPMNFEHLYPLSKATGETIVLSLGKRGRVARLSNVFGPAMSATTFLSAILEEGAARGNIELRTALDASRDYIHVRDAVPVLVKIALHGQRRVYNVASGLQLTNADLTAAIAQLLGCTVTVAPGLPPAPFPAIDNSRIREEFGFEAASLLDELPALVRGLA